MKGINRPVILTEADLLAHSYGKRKFSFVSSTPEPRKPVVNVDVPTLAVKEPEVLETAGVSEAVELQAEVPIGPSPVEKVSEGVAELEALHEAAATVSVLIEKYTKSELLGFAKQLGLDTEGNKAVLAQRLAEANFSLPVD
jgi:hypothetical protein